jgi:hypothetical protein
MNARDEIHVSAIAENHEGSNPKGIADEHEKKAPEVD